MKSARPQQVGTSAKDQRQFSSKSTATEAQHPRCALYILHDDGGE